MKRSIKKSSLTLISIALLSTFSLSQAAQEWSGSEIKLCGKHALYGGANIEEYLLNEGITVEQWNARLREDLRQQVYVSIRSYNMGFNLEPRYLTDEVSIINTNSNNPINISDRSEKIRPSGQFHVLSNLFIRSFDLDPNQILTGRTTISGPGVHHLNEATVRFGDLPISQISYRPSCKNSREFEGQALI